MNTTRDGILLSKYYKREYTINVNLFYKVHWPSITWQDILIILHPSGYFPPRQSEAVGIIIPLPDCWRIEPLYRAIYSDPSLPRGWVFHANSCRVDARFSGLACDFTCRVTYVTQRGASSRVQTRRVWITSALLLVFEMLLSITLPLVISGQDWKYTHIASQVAFLWCLTLLSNPTSHCPHCQDELTSNLV